MAKLISIIFVLPALLQITGCSDTDTADVPKGAPCIWMSDCELGYTCVDGYCAPASSNVDPGPGPGPGGGGTGGGDGTGNGQPGTECTGEVDCGAGRRCDNGYCVAQCTNHNDCPDGQSCNSAGACVIDSNNGSSCQDDAYAGNHSVGTSQEVEAGELTGLKICGANADYFTVYMEPKGVLTATVNFASAEGTLDLEIHGLAERGGTVIEVLATGAGSGDSRTATVTSNVNGPLYVKVALAGNQGELAYSLNIQITDPPKPDPRPDPDPDPDPKPDPEPEPDIEPDPDPDPTCEDDEYTGNVYFDSAAHLTPGTYEDLVICRNIPDLFKITTTEIYQSISVTITFNHSEGDLDLLLFNAPNTNALVDYSESMGNVESINFIGSAVGDYYIAVVGAEAHVTNTYTMTITLGSSCIEDQFSPNYSQGEAALVGSGSYTDLFRCPGQSDWYKLHMGEGDRYNFSIIFDQRDGELDFTMKRPNGTSQASSGYYEERSIAGTASITGEYFLEITRDRDSYIPEPVAMYYDMDLAIIPGCMEDVFTGNDTRQTAALIEAGDYEDLYLCSKSEDWYKIQIPMDYLYSITVDFDTNLADSVEIQLQDGAGVRLKSDSSSYRSPLKIDGKAGYSGFHYLKVGTSGNSTPYTLFITSEAECVEDQFHGNNSVEQATAIEFGVYEDLFICPNEADWFAVELVANNQYRFAVNHNSAAGQLKLSLCTSGSSCSRTTSAGDNLDISGYRPFSTGTHYLKVEGGGWGSTVRNRYDLTFEQQ